MKTKIKPEVKHTPGPWKAERQKNLSSGKDQFVIKANLEADGSGDVICRTPGIEKKNWHEANACLIAAAPELLEACKKALEYFDSIEGADRCGNYFSAVIQKAEGGR